MPETFRLRNDTHLPRLMICREVVLDTFWFQIIICLEVRVAPTKTNIAYEKGTSSSLSKNKVHMCQGRSTPYIGDGHPTFRKSLIMGYIKLLLLVSIPNYVAIMGVLDLFAHIFPFQCATPAVPGRVLFRQEEHGPQRSKVRATESTARLRGEDEGKRLGRAPQD